MNTDIAAQHWKLSLIQTKMTPPRAPRGRVSRQALLARLGAAGGVSLTVVIAPAGFGKTTLLAEWCEVLLARQHLVAWLSLDAEDDDLQQFGAYLLAALCRASEAVGAGAQEMLNNDPLTPVQTLVSVLLNDIAACGREVFLVLDDFDRLASKPIRAMVSRMVHYAPPNFHLLLGVRGEPCLAMGRFHAQEQLLRLDAADLRFSADDAQAFFAQAAGVALDRRGVELLHDATEGWVAGLQLAALALREAGDATQAARGLAGTRRSIDAYLDDTVLAQLPPAMLQFLLRTSMLDRLSAGVCDAVVGSGARSWEKLDWLERHNVFIRALDEDRSWFRYHALLSDALRRRSARQMPQELPALHRRASQWFAAQGLWPEAVRHALAGGAMQQAAQWVENCAMKLVDNSDVRTLLGWIAKLPPELVQARLRLRLARAWSLALSFRAGEASEAVRALAADLALDGSAAGAGAGAEAGAGAGADATLAAEVTAVSAAIAGFADDSPRALELGRQAAACGLPGPAWRHRFAQTALVFGLLYEGRFDEVRRLRALEASHPDDGQELAYANFYRDSMFGLSALVEGRLAEARHIFESVLACAETAVGRSSAAAALPAGYLAALRYECNDLDGAQALVNGYAVVAIEACPLGSLLRYCRAAAGLCLRRGDPQAALAVIDEARQVAHARQWLRLRAGCDAETVRLCLRAGDLARAHQIADALQAAMPAQLPAPMGTFIETWSSHCMIEARLHLAGARPDTAATLLAALHATVAAAGMQHLAAGVALLLALAHEQNGAPGAARTALEGALRYAQANGMVSSFVDEGEPLRALLLGWQRAGAAPAWLDAAFFARLLAAFGAAAPCARDAAAPADDSASELLTAREVEILDHIARGLSNKEIARALRVAPETIKWHLKNIYEKLKVSSRIQAVQSGLGRPVAATQQ